MKRYTADHLYELLPQHIRATDVEQGYPLRALLDVIARQVGVVEDNIAQLYDNWFIETCEDWVVPYIGELIGYEPIETLDDPGISRSPARDRILIPRREVARTLHYRARKGTLSVLEELAMDVTGWVAAAVEFFGSAPVGGALAEQHAAKVKKAVGLDTWTNLQLTGGKTTVVLFVWRKRCYPFTKSTPNYVETQQAEFYTFSPLGNNTPLYTKCERREGPANLANLPIPITREMLQDNLKDYYGEGKSFCIYAPEWPLPPAGKYGAPELPGGWKPIPVPLDDITCEDLSELRKDNRPWFPERENKIVVDPELGRFIFPGRPRQRPHRELRVDYFGGFNADIGGGEYQRPLSAHPDALLMRTPCEGLKTKLDEAIKELESEHGANHILVEITDSGLYLGWLPEIVLKPGQTLQIRAADRCRPVIWIVERSTSLPDSLRVLPYPTSCFILDGILVAGRGLHIDEPEAKVYVHDPRPARVIVRHSTLVPGWLLLPETEPVKSEGASVELNNVLITLLIQRSIIGSISVAQQDLPRVDPSELILEDSILDSTAVEEPALYGEAVQPAYVSLTVRRSTILGEVEVRELPLAENSIFRDRLIVHNRQGGIMRYSYYPNDPDGQKDSHTPCRFRCQTNSANLKLEFMSERYGTADYCRVKDNGTRPHPILEGGEYGGEMGVYYHLFDPVRKAILARRLEEYLPIGVDAQIFLVA
jgi:hypothetical protein